MAVTAPAVTRRRFLIATGAAAGGVLAPGLSAQPQRGTVERMRDAIREVVGDRPITPGRVALEIPALVENGNVVPMTVRAESPMSESDHVRAIHVFNEKNPQPFVASFRLGPRAGRAAVATRIRLADTQTVVAVCEMSDGTLWGAETDVVVTLAACLEEGGL